MSKKKAILITEYLNPPYDEGIKKTVYNLFLELDQKYNLQIICRKGFQKDNIHITNSNKLFISKSIKSQIHKHQPEALIYFPFASATFAGYLRFFILSIFNKKAKNILFALQPKSLNFWQKFVIRFIKPKLALTPSPELHGFWNNMNISNLLTPLYTNLDNFTPLDNPSQKSELSKKYNIPLNSFIISHMGHLNEGRNLKSLIPLQKAGYQVVIVGSSSTPKDSVGPSSLKKELLQEGIIILDGYIERIEEIYQLSDAYIFPVIAKTGSIGMPLSIMEARACGIPVITTDFGSLKTFLDSDFGNIYYSLPEKFLGFIEQLKNDLSIDRLKTKVHQLNEKYLEIIHNTLN